MPETITFELIRKTQREEQSIPKLTQLPKNFYSNVKTYLDQKRKLTKEDKKVALELKNIERLVEDIFNRRERKILNQAIISARTDIPPENLTEEEKKFFNQIVDLIKNRRKLKLNSMFILPKKELTSLVVFKEDTPEFVGADEKIYGPFKKGDIAKLPEENIKVLLERKIVKEFKVNKS
jgi:DNA replication factor GINS